MTALSALKGRRVRTLCTPRLDEQKLMHFINNFYKSKPLFQLGTTFFCVLLAHSVQGETTESIAWKRLETAYTILFYQSTEDLKKFCTRIQYGPKNRFARGSSSDITIEDIKENPVKKTDAVFERVQDILGMQKKMDKVNIHIYKNDDQLRQAYRALYQDTCTIRAWYRYRNNTIYLNANDLHEGMLAHELAHAIVDHYLLVRPPRATAEIIARYVDSHLKNKTPTYDPPGQILGLSD